MERATKIVATIGPASQDEPILTDLLLAGVNVARLNFSHGNHETHARNYQRLREKSAQIGTPLCIMQDLQGPKIRVGDLVENFLLAAGDSLTLTTKKVVGTPNLVYVDFPHLTKFTKVGGRILLDDGNIELRIEAIESETVRTKVIVGGILKPKKGVNLPGAELPITALTKKDKVDLAFGLSLGVDVIALSFVRTAQDVITCRKAIARMAPERADTPIIAKLERPEALKNLEEIVHAADGVMVARGDLGVEMSPEVVPIAQKQIIECANRHGRLVITATQMLDSMVNNPRPTRAEASDVANAILDGTDAVMLSGETATGKYPVKVVETMDAIIRQAEAHRGQWGQTHDLLQPEIISDDAFYIAQAAGALARDRNVAAVAVFTHSGRTAHLMAKMRPDVPILAFTSAQSTYTRLPLVWGVRSHLVPHAETIEIMLAEVDKALVECNPIQPGQQVVLICGYPMNSGVPANLALLHTVGSEPK
jgi:pyruvate kinase